MLGKLREVDAARLETVLADLYRAGCRIRPIITKFERGVILAYLGVSAEEVVQKRMGRV